MSKLFNDIRGARAEPQKRFVICTSAPGMKNVIHASKKCLDFDGKGKGEKNKLKSEIKSEIKEELNLSGEKRGKSLERTRE